MSDIYYVLLET